LRVRELPLSGDIDRGSMLIQSWWASMRRGVFEVKDIRRLARAFAALDTDGSGSVDSSELRDVLGLLGDNPLEEEEIEALLKAGDSNGDGAIDVDEFLALAQAGYVCLSTDTLRRVADVCNCNPKLLAQHNGIEERALDERLPSGFVLKISATSRIFSFFSLSMGMTGTRNMTSPELTSPGAAPRSNEPSASELEAVSSTDHAVCLVHAWWHSMRLGLRPKAPSGLAQSLAPLDESGQGELGRESLRDLVTLLGENPLEEDSADALVAALFQGQSQRLPISSLVDLMEDENQFVMVEGERLQDVVAVCGCDPLRLARLNGHRPSQVHAGVMEVPMPKGTLLTLPILPAGNLSRR